MSAEQNHVTIATEVRFGLLVEHSYPDQYFSIHLSFNHMEYILLLYLVQGMALVGAQNL